MTPRAAIRYHRAFSRQQQQYEKAAAKAFYTALRGQLRQFIREAKKHPGGMELKALDSISALPMAKAYRRVALRVALGYGAITGQEMGLEETGGKSATPALRTKAGDPNDAEMIEAYLRLYGAKKVVGITEKTRAWIAEQVTQGQQEGLTFAQIAKNLITKDISATRAWRIARTESVGMMNLGRFLAAMKSNFQKVKTWVSSHDKRVRPGITSPHSEFDHHEADIQQADLEDPFDVSGEKLLFPGDTSQGASAGNVINCRCSFGLETKRDVNGRMLVKPTGGVTERTPEPEQQPTEPGGIVAVLPATRPAVGGLTLIQNLIIGVQLSRILGLTFLQMFDDENTEQ